MIIFFYLQGALESDDRSEEDIGGEDGEEGTDYMDSDPSGIAQVVELPQPLPPRTSQQHSSHSLTRPVYFILVWQYKNYISGNAIKLLLKLCSSCSCVLGSSSWSTQFFCLVLAGDLPTALYSARKLLKTDWDNFMQYAVFPKCPKLYHTEDIIVNNGCQTFGKTCQHIAFPQAKRQRCCGSQLALKVVVRNGGIKFYDLKTL